MEKRDTNLFHGCNQDVQNPDDHVFEVTADYVNISGFGFPRGCSDGNYRFLNTSIPGKGFSKRYLRNAPPARLT